MKWHLWIRTGGGDIPEDPSDALRQNALSLTRNQAVDQCQKMTNLVDQVIYKAKQKWKLLMLSFRLCDQINQVQNQSL
jgi:hypothetical protein